MNITDRNSRITQQEYALVRELEKTPMTINMQSLRFCIADIVNSGTMVAVEEGRQNIRTSHYDIRLSEKRREELKEELKDISKKIEALFTESPIDEEYLSVLNKKRNRCKWFLDADGTTVTFETYPLGEYSPSTDTIILYIDNIEEDVRGNNRADRASILISTLVHEFFHAFYHKHCKYAGTAKQRVEAVDEAMVEFSMLTYLDYVAERKRSIEFDTILRVATESVRGKKGGEGSVPAYGFGAFLFEQCRNIGKSIRPIEWIEQYTNRFGDIDASEPNVQDYVARVFPFYQSGETETFCSIVDILFSGDFWQGTNTSKMIAELDRGMQYGCRFIFKKMDNSIRVAVGTKNQAVLDRMNFTGTGRPTAPCNYFYIDLDRNDSRCFRRDRLLAIIS